MFFNSIKAKVYIYPLIHRKNFQEIIRIHTAGKLQRKMIKAYLSQVCGISRPVLE